MKGGLVVAGLVAAVLCADLGTAADTLVQLQFVTRHGARTALPKDAAKFSEGGASLTRQGSVQQQSFGAEIRSFYGITKGFPAAKQYTPDDVWLTSSDFDRTISSAMSFASGLWPGNSPDNFAPNISAQVPVHTVLPVNDVTVRAYRNCPEFRVQLSKLYASQPFLDKAAANKAFTTQLATLFPDYAVDGNIPLPSIWNVFDAVNVAKDLNPSSALANILTPAQFTTLSELTAWVEHQRYGKAVAKGLLGSNLWNEIMGRVRSLYDFDGKGALHPPHKMVVYSAHYPTILGLFAALDLQGENPSVLSATAVPNYASSIVFEVWQHGTSTSLSEDTAYIRVRYKGGAHVAIGSSPYLQLSKSCVDAAAADANVPSDACPMKTFRALLEKSMYPNLETWCWACGNTVSSSCLAAQKKCPESKPGILSTLSGEDGVIVGIIIGMLFTTFCLLSGVAEGVKKKCCKTATPRGRDHMELSPLH